MRTFHCCGSPYAKHRGLQKRFEGLEPAAGVLLAERVEGIATVAHALAFTHALEAQAHVRVPRPPRWCGAAPCKTTEGAPVLGFVQASRGQHQAHVAETGSRQGEVVAGTYRSTTPHISALGSLLVYITFVAQAVLDAFARHVREQRYRW